MQPELKEGLIAEMKREGRTMNVKRDRQDGTTWRGLAAVLLVLALLLVAGGTLAQTAPGAGDGVAPAGPQAPTLAGGAPGLVHYQGYLVDGAGDPIDGSVDLRFRLYPDDPAVPPLCDGTTHTWEEVHTGVAVSDGYFSVMLGSLVGLGPGDFSMPHYCLQVSVDTGGGYEDLPQQQLAAAPYAFQAEEANNAWSLSGNVGTTSGTNYVGTADSQPLVVKTNGVEALRVDTDGQVGIGLTDPNAALDVDGQIHGSPVVARWGTSNGFHSGGAITWDVEILNTAPSYVSASGTEITFHLAGCYAIYANVQQVSQISPALLVATLDSSKGVLSCSIGGGPQDDVAHHTLAVVECFSVGDTIWVTTSYDTRTYAQPYTTLEIHRLN